MNTSTDVLHVRINRAMRRALKVAAAREERTMREVVEEALRAYFSTRRKP